MFSSVVSSWERQNQCERYTLKTSGLETGQIIIQTGVRRGSSCLVRKKREPLDVGLCVRTTKLTMMKPSSAICWRSFWAAKAFFSAVKGTVSPALVTSTLQIVAEVKLIFAVGMHLLLRQVLLAWPLLHNVTTQTCGTIRWQKVRSGFERRILAVGLLQRVCKTLVELQSESWAEACGQSHPAALEAAAALTTPSGRPL